jgi:hypothetical protein
MPSFPRATTLFLAFSCSAVVIIHSQSPVGREVAIARHLQDGEEFALPLRDLLAHGQRLFTASWTIEDGGGRPLSKGTGGKLSDASSPLAFPRNFNRISAPDANSCAGCHNLPFGIAGGGGDIVANVFVLGQRFDFATFDAADVMSMRGASDEVAQPANLQSIANSRATLGMFGSGYIEMLARQITEDLQAQRDATLPGSRRALASKGISYGTIGRTPAGQWDTTGVVGIAAPSLTTTGPLNPPSLVIRPFHQAGNVVSIRQFSNNAFNHHHGIQSTERFGRDTDPDGDGVTNEMTRADGCAGAGDSERSGNRGGRARRRAPLCVERVRRLSHSSAAAGPARVAVHRAEPVQSGESSESSRRRSAGAYRRPHQRRTARPAPEAHARRRDGAGVHRLEIARHHDRRSRRSEYRGARHEPAGRLAVILPR